MYSNFIYFFISWEVKLKLKSFRKARSPDLGVSSTRKFVAPQCNCKLDSFSLYHFFFFFIGLLEFQVILLLLCPAQWETLGCLLYSPFLL